MRIVVDAMGSDTNPATDVLGAVLAARELPDTIILVGRHDQIDKELNRIGSTPSNIEIVHANDLITMADKPATIGKSKPNSSMHIGMGLVKSGDADAFITAGNTGAALAIAMLYTLRRIPGVLRPALSAIFPIANRPVMFLDVGATTDPKPEWMLQYAIMGTIYLKKVMGLENPRVGLLSNGEEEGKGSELVLGAYELIKKTDLNFIGNVEPKEVLSGHVDVLVSDGFTGNIMVKTFEAAARYISQIIRDEIRSNAFSTIGGILARGAFRRVRSRIDTSELGGAPLLGVNGVVMISHGGSDARAIKNAVHQANKAVKSDAITAISAQIAASSGQ